MKFIVCLFLLVISAKAFGLNNDDSLKVVHLIINDYKTLGNWDISSHTNNCTEDYRLIENGAVQTLKDEIEYFRKNSGRVIKRSDDFEFKTLRVFGQIAYTIYELKTTILENGAEKNYWWTESAVCRKEKGVWKIALIHSTPIK